MSEYSIHLVSWHDAQPLLHKVREVVFVKEQNVPLELEWDGLDETCRHALALDTHGNAIGCGRITPDAHIGRMCVLPEWRGKRVGSAILEALLDYAESMHLEEVELSAQTHALPFYHRFGFEEEGDEYLDAGLPHRTMRLRLA